MPWTQEVGDDPVRHLFTALTNAGLVVEREESANNLVFLKVMKGTQLEAILGVVRVAELRFFPLR